MFQRRDVIKILKRAATLRLSQIGRDLIIKEEAARGGRLSLSVCEFDYFTIFVALPSFTTMKRPFSGLAT